MFALSLQPFEMRIRRFIYSTQEFMRDSTLGDLWLIPIHKAVLTFQLKLGARRFVPLTFS